MYRYKILIKDKNYICRTKSNDNIGVGVYLVKEERINCSSPIVKSHSPL